MYGMNPKGVARQRSCLVVPIICYHWLKRNSNMDRMFMSGTEKRGGETKQKDKLLTSDCLVRGKFVAGKK